MKLKDFLSNISKNKNNGQLVTSIRKNKLKQVGMTKEDLFNLNIDLKFKNLLMDK
jgi:hypothetical protein